MRSTHIVAVAICFFLQAHFLCFETSGSSIDRPGKIGKADDLGEDFQKQGPWSRHAPEGGDDMSQPEGYLAAPESPQKGSDINTVQYPLCYNPDTQLYEYCYSVDSSDFKLRLQSPDFRFWWRRGRTCPPGYHFVPEEGCYRH